MRVVTRTTEEAIVGGHEHSCHAENINIAALLALNLNTMEFGKAYPIGDRNWDGWDMSRDIPYLQRTIRTQNKRRQSPYLKWDANPRPQCLGRRKQVMP